MNSSTTTPQNSLIAITQRVREGKLGWTWPLILVAARLVLAMLVQALVAGFFWLRGDPTPWQAAAPWWIVYGTLIDLGCLALLTRQLRKEGLRLFDLLGFERRLLGKDLLLGLGYTFLFVLMAMAGGMIFAPLIYGVPQAPAPMSGLPLWGTLYALLIWPLIWGIVEQMTYQGYALPRLEVLSGKRWLAVVIVAMSWAAQHIALPMMPDWRWVLYRFASSLILAFGVTALYLRIRRLLPLIIAHWLADFSSVLMLVVLPMLAAS